MGDFLSNFENKENQKKAENEVVPTQDAFSEEEFVYDNDYAKNKIIKRIISIFIVFMLFIGSFILYNELNYVVMKNFVGMEFTSMSNFVVQNKFAVIKNSEFSETIDEGIVIEQDLVENTKIKKGSTLIITVSSGPDPDKIFEVPNFEEMTHNDIINWKEENKLYNVTVRTIYDDEIQSGNFVNVVYIEGSEELFKRKNRVTIYTSKGAEPVPTDVELIDLRSQAKEFIINWGEENEVVFKFKYYYSQSIPKNVSIRQSIAGGIRVEKGSTVTIDLSLGASVVIADFSQMTKDQAVTWGADNNYTVVIEEYYLANYSVGKFISQSITKGKTVSVDGSIKVSYALGNPFINSFVGSSKYNYYSFINNLNSKKTSLTTTEKYEFSATVAKNSIIFQSKLNEKVNLNQNITIIVSKGTRYIVEDIVGADEETARASNLCAQVTCLFEEVDNSDDAIASKQVISQSISAGSIVGLPEMITINVKK